MDELPTTITTADDAAVALRAAWLAATGDDPLWRPAGFDALHRVPMFMSRTAPVTFRWQRPGQLPPVLAFADRDSVDSSGYVGDQNFVDYYGVQVHPVTSHPIRRGQRGTAVLRDLSWADDTPAGCQAVATAALTAREYSRQVAVAREHPDMPWRQLQTEVADLDALAATAEALLPSVSSWWPDVHAAISSDVSQQPAIYTTHPISLKR